jgi:hypothetical protein
MEEPSEALTGDRTSIWVAPLIPLIPLIMLSPWKGVKGGPIPVYRYCLRKALDLFLKQMFQFTHL